MKKRLNRLIPALLLMSVLLAVILKSSWIVDDGYISFRYIKNLFNGNGLRWNLYERVQAYTNPLYVFAMIPFYAVFKDMFISSILLSTILSMSAVFIAIRPRENKDYMPYVICMIALTTSKAFVDYSTAGLENPMTFFIVALFYSSFFRMDKPSEEKNFLKLCFIASLITINRIDAILMFIPPLCYAFFKDFKWKKVGFGFLGFSPFIVWEIFSLIYYGFLFPNTAYAKLNVTTSKLEAFRRGIKYILASNIYGDNITLIAILLVFILGIYLIGKKRYRIQLAILSCALYVVYIVYIGGDFMVGRFTSGPFFLAMIILYEYMVNIEIDNAIIKKNLRNAYIAIAVVVLFLGLIPQTSTITAPIRYQNYYDYQRYTNPIDSPRDVRSYYYENTGFTHYVMDIVRDGYNPDKEIVLWTLDEMQQEAENVYVAGGIGFMGYFADDNIILIDKYALADPLLARIPAPPNQFAAHNQRGIPLGYAQTLKTGENKIENPALHEYYDKLSLIISGKVFSKDRLITIVNMNLGKYDYLIEEYTKSEEYRQSVFMYGR